MAQNVLLPIHGQKQNPKVTKNHWKKTLQLSRLSTPISVCDAGSSGDTDESLTRKPCKTRHQTKPVIKELCIFCQAESHKEHLRFVSLRFH